MMAKMDLTGQRFGRLLVLEEAEPYYKNWRTYRRWLCLCDCGNQKVIRQESLTKGFTKSCGCLHAGRKKDEAVPRAKTDLTGQRFGMLLVLEEVEPYVKNWRTYRRWLCLCDCGNKKVVMQQSLTGGFTKSCGCLQGRNSGADLIGQRFGHLLVLGEAERHVTKSGKKERQWVCRCELCGNEKTILQRKLKEGRVKTCGCVQNEQRDKKFRMNDLLKAYKEGRVVVFPTKEEAEAWNRKEGNNNG